MSSSRPWAGALRQVAAFAPMCAFAAAHWAALVANPPIGRVAAIVAITTACGLVLALSARLEGGGNAAPRFLRIATVAVATVLSLLAAGLAPATLGPTGWGELVAGLSRGLDGLLGVAWPYDGSDAWVRQTVLLAIPAICMPAAAFALWPPAAGPGGPEAAAARRTGALVLLLSLFAVAATERPLPAELERGALLLVLLAAWLFLPRLGRPRLGAALAAAAAVLAAGIVSLPIAAAIEPERPWIDYGTLSLAGGPEHGRFDWEHSYGPLRWPRTGETMLEVRSRAPHFWKMQTLGRFDGEGWRDSGRRRTLDRETELTPYRPLAESDVARIGFTVRGLRSQLVAGAGVPLSITPPGPTSTFADGSSERRGPALGAGDRYSVEAYVPEPGPSDLRGAAGEPPPFGRDYLEIDLPAPSGTDRGRSTAVTLGRSGESDSAAEAAVLGSPYAGVYRLAQRLGRGRDTTYDVARAVERHLRQGYDYDERPAVRENPLASFVLEDKAGHCQHFSGAMALMLRMNGIPARVATGFAPGTRARGGYRVRDLDAHSWVEVLFPGIGWAAFDPTPGGAPAARPPDRTETAAAARRRRTERRQRRGAQPPRRSERRERRPRELRARGTVALESASPATSIALGVLALGAGGLLVRFVVIPRLRRRASMERSSAEDVAELRAALERLGWPVPAEVTLVELEQRLDEGAGPAAARYARRLRERRFAGPVASASARPDRRALRRALTARAGPLTRARGLLVLPPAALRPRPRAGAAGRPTPA